MGHVTWGQAVLGWLATSWGVLPENLNEESQRLWLFGPGSVQFVDLWIVALLGCVYIDIGSSKRSHQEKEVWRTMWPLRERDRTKQLLKLRARLWSVLASTFCFPQSWLWLWAAFFALASVGICSVKTMIITRTLTNINKLIFLHQELSSRCLGGSVG